MPPLFTSTSWTTLVRKAASALRQVPPTAAIAAKPPTPYYPSPQILKRARLALRKVAHQTFPSLTTSSEHLAYSFQPVRLGKQSTQQFGRSSIRYGSSNAFRTAYRLPRSHPSGASIPANVGLGPARTFASGPASQVYHTNIPMGFRALQKLLDQDDETKGYIPRATRYRPYTRRSSRVIRRQHQGQIRRMSHFSVDSGLLGEFSQYFPLRKPIEQSIELPLCPEEIITPGMVSTLSLPLSPDLHALLDPSTKTTYAEAEIGVSILANLCSGTSLSWLEAMDLHRQNRLNPLLARLDALGILKEDGDETGGIGPKTEVVLLRDGSGRPDILKLIFHERSIRDIKVLLGETLESEREGGGGDWWTLSDRMALLPEALTIAESRAILEDWADTQIREERLQEIEDQRQIEMVLPILDIDGNTGSIEMSWNTSGGSTPVTPMELDSVPYSYTPSTTSTPSHQASPGWDTPISDDTDGVNSWAASLTESLLSQLTQSTSSGSEHEGWEIHPSDDDAEVESAIALSDSDSAGAVERDVSDGGWSFENLEEQEEEDLERSPSPSFFASWSGTGQGFGLAQPW